MSEGETKLVDTSGDYRYVVRNGEPVDEACWRSSRVLLTNERLILAGTDGKQSIQHGNVRIVDDPDSVVPDDVAADGATPLRVGENVVLIDAPGVKDFEREYCRATLDTEVVLVKHPAVVGGVVQGTEWTKARIKITDDEIRLALADGGRVRIERDDIGEFEEDEREVAGEERTVMEVEHSQDGISVETHISGRAWNISVLREVLEEGAERNRADLDLDPVEKQVVMALHTGVSPFDVPEFVGADVEEIEEIYDRLIELDVIEVVRERTEVAMTAQGRSIAGESTGES